MLEKGNTTNEIKEHPDFESIHVGCEGGIVLMIQNSLNHLGYTLEKNGIFSQEMYDVIVKFQEDHNLTADGIVDYQTMVVLDKDFIDSI